MMKMLNKKRKKGFTLIELIVVIAILGILAAIAIPRFTNVQANAQSTADKATARTILSAVTMAEASLSTTGAAASADATSQAAFIAEVNKSLNDPVVYGGNTGWAISYQGTPAKWVVLKAGTVITP